MKFEARSLYLGTTQTQRQCCSFRLGETQRRWYCGPTCASSSQATAYLELLAGPQDGVVWALISLPAIQQRREKVEGEGYLILCWWC